MADHVLVDHERQLAPLAGLDPIQAAPLTDAGLTSLHAITLITPRLPRRSRVAVVGVGGLGHLAVQLLRAMTDAAVVAFDTRPQALDLAQECGADDVVRLDPSGPHVPDPNGPDTGDVHGIDVRGGDVEGVDAVLDFVGAQATLRLAATLLRPGGDLVVVGSGGGSLVLDKARATLPPGARVSLPFWGSRPELDTVLDLARTGALKVAVETFPLADAAQAVHRLRSGTLRGRAVLVP